MEINAILMILAKNYENFVDFTCLKNYENVVDFVRLNFSSTSANVVLQNVENPPERAPRNGPPEN